MTSAPIMTAGEFRQFQEYVYQKSGMYFPVSRQGYIEQKVQKRMEALKLDKVSEYLAIVRGELIKTEIIHLFNEITINETFFFRDRPQLDAFCKQLIPDLTAAGPRKISILSAGCSSGEEAYTLGILMRETFPQLSFSVLGIDISDRVLAKAIRGEYTDYAVRFLPEKWLKKYFEQDGGIFRFRDEFRAGIRFAKTNLMDLGNGPVTGPFDIIFCRYVLIYFDLESKRQVLSRFYQQTPPGGYLVLGNSESIFSVSDQFHMLHYPSAIVYQRR